MYPSSTHAPPDAAHCFQFMLTCAIELQRFPPHTLKATGNWFAGSERNLEQLIASFDVLADLFTQEDAASDQSMPHHYDPSTSFVG